MKKPTLLIIILLLLGSIPAFAFRKYDDDNQPVYVYPLPPVPQSHGGALGGLAEGISKGLARRNEERRAERLEQLRFQHEKELIRCQQQGNC